MYMFTCQDHYKRNEETKIHTGTSKNAKAFSKSAENELSVELIQELL